MNITFEDLQHPQFARLHSTLAVQNFRLIADDMPRILATIELDPAIDSYVIEGNEMATRIAAKQIITRAVNTVARALIAEGVDRSERTSTALPGQSPEPHLWPNGIVFQRVAETALQELDTLHDLATLTSADAPPRFITELGVLLTEVELADLAQVSVNTLRSWRVKHEHFEFVKWPGSRGTIRYTERGVRAFFAAHLHTVAP